MLLIETLRAGVAVAVFAIGAPAQSDNYTSIDVVAEKATQLGYHASITKDCSPAPPPQVHVLTAPKFGVLTIRRAVLTTGQANACPNVKSPAYVVFYQSRPAYV